METSGQRAILFGDVCDSTAIYEAIGDAKALALVNRLFKLLDKQVNTNGGTTVKTLGDGMVCQFREADAAFHAACGMQEAAVKLGVEFREADAAFHAACGMQEAAVKLGV